MTIETQSVERLEERKRYLKNSRDRRALLVHIFDKYYSEESGFDWERVWRDHPTWQRLLGWDKRSLRHRVYVAAHDVKNMLLRRRAAAGAQHANNGNGDCRTELPNPPGRAIKQRKPLRAQQKSDQDWPEGLPEFCPRCFLNLKMLAMSMGIALKHSPTLLQQ